MAEHTAYDGDVSPGGASQARELGNVTLRKAAVSEMSNNVYLLTCTATGEQLLVDAADDWPRIKQLINEGTGRCDAIVTTHQHWDHVRALEEAVQATGARTYAGADDADALPVSPDVRLEQGDTVAFGDVVLDVVHLRGHTPGSIALAFKDADGRMHLITGDSLFPGGVGNTKNEGQSFESLIEDVTTRVFDVYDDETWCYPGHGGDTRLCVERPHLQEWRDRGW